MDVKSEKLGSATGKDGLSTAGGVVQIVVSSADIWRVMNE